MTAPALDVLGRTKPNDHGPTCVCDACHEHRAALADLDALVQAARALDRFDSAGGFGPITIAAGLVLETLYDALARVTGEAR